MLHDFETSTVYKATAHEVVEASATRVRVRFSYQL